MERPKINLPCEDHPCEPGRMVDLLYPFEQGMPTTRIGLVAFTKKCWNAVTPAVFSLATALQAVQLVVAGRFATAQPLYVRDSWTQVQINATQDRAHVPSTDSKEILRRSYISSIIAFTSVLEVIDSVNVFSFPDFESTIKDTDLVVNLGDLSVSANFLPSFRLASFKPLGGGSADIFVLFPGLYSPCDVCELDDDMRMAIYEDVIYPAFRPTAFEALSRTSGTYKTALTRKPFTVKFEPVQVKSLGARLQRFADAHHNSQLHRPMFMIQHRGLKSSYNWLVDHNHLDQQHMFEKVRSVLTPRVWQDGQVYCDWGTDISVPGRCLRILASAHAEIVRLVIPGLSVQDAAKLVEHSDYRRLELASVYQLGEFTYTPSKPSPLTNGLCRLKVIYTPRLPGQLNKFPYHALRQDITQTFPGKIKELGDLMNQQAAFLYNMVVLQPTPAPELDTMITVSVRAKFEHAQRFETQLTRVAIISHIIMYTTRQWWEFVIIRLRALELIVHMFERSSISHRQDQNALQLSAVVVLMLHSLFMPKRVQPVPSQWHTNCEASAHEQILSASGRHEFVSHTNGTLSQRLKAVGQEHGLYFVSDIVFGGSVDECVPQLHSSAAELAGTHLHSSLCEVMLPAFIAAYMGKLDLKAWE